MLRGAGGGNGGYSWMRKVPGDRLGWQSEREGRSTAEGMKGSECVEGWLSCADEEQPFVQPARNGILLSFILNEIGHCAYYVAPVDKYAPCMLLSLQHA